MSSRDPLDLLDELAGLVMAAEPDDLDGFTSGRAIILELKGAPTLAMPPTKALVDALAQQWDRVLSEPASARSSALKSLGEAIEAIERAVRPSFSLSEEVDDELLAQFVSNTQLALEEFESDAIALTDPNPEALARIKRRLHTLKGESGMMGLSELERVCHATETYLEAARPLDDRNALLLRVKDFIAVALDHYLCRRSPAEAMWPILSELLGEGPSSVGSPPPAPARASEVGSANPSSQPSRGNLRAPPTPAIVQPETSRNSAGTGVPWDEQDVELVAEFLHESRETLQTVDQSLLEIERDGVDPERINKLFRAFHTLKGVAGFLHLEQVTGVAHTTETMLDRVRTGQLETTGGVLDLVFDSTTIMRELTRLVEESLTQSVPLANHPGVASLIGRLGDAISGSVPSGEQSVAQPGEKLGQILVRQGLVTERQIDECLKDQMETGRRLGEALIAHGSVAPKDVAHALRAQRGQTSAGVVKLREVVKVDLERVDSLVETIGELVIVESMVSHAPELRNLPPHLRNSLSQFAKITRELQEIGMRMRMVPVRGEFQKMTRMVRDLAKKADKQVRVDVRGEGTEMDRSMVEQIADPLVHLIRNAVDHGVESPERRTAQGKPPVGTIVLSASHQGGSIVIEISDDGKGIDREAVIEKAISRGLIKSGASMSDSEVFDLIFMPGFSTAAQITEISGRGVGMDVVKRNIEAMRGRILTTSTPGQGSTFRLVLPLTLAIIDGMVVRCGNEHFILPTQSIVESLQPSADMLSTMAGARELVVVRGNALPLLRLSALLSIDGAETEPTRALVVIVDTLTARVGILVDEVMAQQQVVIKSVGDELNREKVFSGAAIMSSGRVGLILHLDELVARAELHGGAASKTHASQSSSAELVA